MQLCNYCPSTLVEDAVVEDVEIWSVDSDAGGLRSPAAVDFDPLPQLHLGMGVGMESRRGQTTYLGCNVQEYDGVGGVAGRSVPAQPPETRGTWA